LCYWNEQFAWLRVCLDTSSSEKDANWNASVRDGSDYGVRGGSERMTETLKQAGMIVVLVLLSEGLFVLGRAMELGHAAGNRLTASAQFVAGAILCSSALMLLYSLGTRDEK